jgi:hypothetical protein
MIHSFTTDMWEGRRNAVEEYIAEHHNVTARLVVDRFHIFVALSFARFEGESTLPPPSG